MRDHGSGLPLCRLFLWLLVFTFSGCSEWHGDSAGTGGEEPMAFDVTGRIVSIPDDRKTVVIEHEEIPDFMPAMTMPFYLANEGVIEGFEPGNVVRFRYVVSRRRSWIEEMKNSDGAAWIGPTEGVAVPQRPRFQVPRLEPGDPVPGFELVNQEGETFSLSDFHGRFVALTFIFTRCPVPEFCPKISHQFRQVQRVARRHEELRDRFQLLSITIDPGFDTPEVMGKYARSFTDDLETWTFATASADRIEEMITRFSVYVEENAETSTLDHTLTTALVGPDGTLLQVWRGNGWDPEEVVSAMREVLGKTQP